MLSDMINSFQKGARIITVNVSEEKTLNKTWTFIVDTNFKSKDKSWIR